MNKYHRIILFVFLQFIVLFFTSFIAEKSSEISKNEELRNRTIKQYNTIIDQYSNYLRSQMDSTRTVGAALTIVSGDSVLLIDTYGVRKAGTADSVNKHTLFRLASVSKGFAGVLACILDNEGIIGLDEPVEASIADFKFPNYGQSGRMTIKQTLNHTTGFVPHAYDDLIENGFGYPQLISQLKTAGPAIQPGLEYAYQNAAFSILDTVLKVKTDCDYAEWLNEKIFQPLGMFDASVGLAPMQLNPNVAYPHRMVNGRYNAMKLNAGYYNVLPAAGVNASINDMSKWLKALLGYSPQTIDAAVLNRIISPTIETPLQRKYTYHWGKVENKYYSIGWRIYDYMGHRIIYHGGFVNGYRAEIAFCPELNIGIAYLQNSPNKTASLSVPEFWKRFFTYTDSPKNENIQPIVEKTDSTQLSFNYQYSFVQ